jgi:hypothetical protein
MKISRLGLQQRFIPETPVRGLNSKYIFFEFGSYTFSSDGLFFYPARLDWDG